MVGRSIEPISFFSYAALGPGWSLLLADDRLRAPAVLGRRVAMPVRSIESLWRFVRTRGIWRSLDRLVFGYLFGTQRWVVFHTRLDGPPVPAQHGGFTFRPYAPGDAPALAAFEPYIRRSRFLAWIAQGSFVHLAFHGDRPVAYRIVSTHGPHGPLSRVVRPGPDEVWVVDLYCLPEYRGQAVPNWLVRCMDRHLAAAGYRARYSAALLDNRAGTRSAFKRGAGFHALVTYRRRPFRQTLAVSTDIEEALAAAGLGEVPSPLAPPPS